MTFSISPAVTITERDLTNIIPNVATTAAGMTGAFKWGPLNEVTLIDNELNLVKYFGKPDAYTYKSFFSAANFLSYGNKLRLARIVDEDTAKNATAEATTGSAADGTYLYTTGTGLLVKNDEHYVNSYDNETGGNCGAFCAKYSGALGNGLKVSVCPSSAAFSGNISGTVSSSGTTLTGTETAFLTELEVGSVVRDAAGTETRSITAIANNTSATISSAFSEALSGDTVHADWEYKGYFSSAPGTSDYATARGSSNDEIHVIVVDEDGVFQTPGYILETYSHLSKASDAIAEDGTSAYYKTAINRRSQYVRWMDHLPTASNWGYASTGAVTYTAINQPRSFSLAGGADGNSTVDDADKLRGYALFANPEVVDVSIMIGAEASSTVADYIISDICETRKDCVAVISPEQADVVNNSGSEATDAIAFKTALSNSASSYGIMDCNWKKQYDKYNQVYRYIPANGDIAGLMVRTDTNYNPWWSPAGLNRGVIKSCVKLAWNPTKAERDDLYIASINPIITTPEAGTVLWGNKTMQVKPSAFDRINVRRLFIVLEKAIATAAKYMLFEFNDEFSRVKFVSMVEPYLERIKAGRGIYEYEVVCDTTNNTAEVIDNDQFIGDIYIKPTRVADSINLNFIAVGTGVEFNEVIGKY